MLTTRRLALTAVTRSDREALHVLWTSPGLRRYLFDDEVISYHRTDEFIETSERLFDTCGFGLWLARCHDSTGLVGFGGFWHFREPPELELLYGVSEVVWNRGFGTEIARAVIRYGQRSLGMRTIRASTDAANTPSVRLLEKLGFAFVHRASTAGIDTVFYAL
jgi:ribosomal-protein-alanine N-acetyltransferase